MSEEEAPPAKTVGSPGHAERLPRFFGLVPAAGLSRRMGVQKLGLRLGNKTVLQHVLSRLMHSNLTGILVVLGPSSASLACEIPDNVETVVLPAPTSEMRETVEKGLARLTEFFDPSPHDGLLLALGDHPSVRTEVVNELIAQFRKDPRGVHVPTFSGKRGHPVLFSWATLLQLQNIPSDRGLNELLRREPESVHEVPIDFADVLEDIDVPQDFERLSHRDWTE